MTLIELHLDGMMREALLNYDIEHSENCYDRNMYYITNSENQILYDIIFGLLNDERRILEKIGFDEEDIKIIDECDVNIKFTNKSNYFIKYVWS